MVVWIVIVSTVVNPQENFEKGLRNISRPIDNFSIVGKEHQDWLESSKNQFT